MTLQPVDMFWLEQLCLKSGSQVWSDAPLNSQLRRARVFNAFIHIAEMLEPRLVKRLNCRASLKGFELVSGLEDSSSIAAFNRHGLVAVRLRIFDGRAVLLLELPCVEYISSCVLGLKRSASLAAPTDDELIALSFVCADFLADGEGFAEQRAYLSGIRCYPLGGSSERDASSYLRQLIEEVRSGRAAMMQFTARLQERPYAAALVFCPKVTRRILYHSRFSLPQGKRRKALGQIVGELSCEITVPVVPASSLCALKLGDVLELTKDLKSCSVKVFTKCSRPRLGESSLVFELEGLESPGKLNVRSGR